MTASGWILWAVWGFTTSFAGGYSGPTYKAIEGFDTKAACLKAAIAYDASYKGWPREKSECWPAGHDVNLHRRAQQGVGLRP